MATITAAAGGGNWSNAGTWDVGVPTVADDVVFNASSGNVTIDGTATAKTLTCTGYTGTLTHNAGVTLTVAGSITLASGMTYTLGNANTSQIWVTGDSTITSAGKTIGYMRLDGSGKTYTIADALTISHTLYLRQGTLHIDGASDDSELTHTIGYLLCHDTSLTRALYLGKATIGSSPSGNPAWRLESGANLTFDSGTSTINFTYAGTSNWSFSGGTGLTWYDVNINLTGDIGSVGLNHSNTFHNLTVTNGAYKKFQMGCGGDITVTGTLTITGNSAVNRILVCSKSLGTARTITAATVSVTNADFRDITGAGAGSWDLSAVTGGSGDCGGNTDITFTTADDWYWNGSGTRNFSDYTYWYTATNGGGSQMASTRTVLPQDTCYINGDSIDGATTIDQDLPRIPGIDCSGASAFNLHFNNIAQTIYGSFILVANVTLTGGSAITFEGRGAYGVDTNNRNLGTVNVNVFSTANSLTLLSALQANLTVNYGTFDTDTFNLTLAAFNSSNSNARKLLFGSGTHTCEGSWTMTTTTNLDTTAGLGETSTIVMSSGFNRNFIGGGLTFNNITCAGNGETTISGATNNTFNTFTINAPKTVKFTAGTTTTVNSFVATGDAVNAITCQSTTASSPWYIVDANGGTNENDYLNVTDSNAQAGVAGTFFYGANGSGDAYSDANGWGASPSTGTVKRRLLMGVGI